MSQEQQQDQGGLFNGFDDGQSLVSSAEDLGGVVIDSTSAADVPANSPIASRDDRPSVHRPEYYRPVKPLGAELAEAPASVYTVMYPPDGGWVSVTVRNFDILAALADFEVALDHLKSKGWTTTRPESMGGSGLPPSTPGQPVPAQASQFTGTQSEPSEPNPVDDISGTDVLHSIIISHSAGGKLIMQANVGKFRYPFNDHRGPEAWIKLFDASMKVQQKQLESPMMFDFDQRNIFPQEIYADWEKVTRKGKSYYNILKIHF